MTKEIEKRFYYKKSRIQQLKGFCNTVNLGTIAKAAQVMNLTASSITMQIKALEEDLGVNLFKREKNRLKITKDGRRLYDMSVSHVNAISNICSEFLEKKQRGESQNLSIAAQNIITTYNLPKYIKEYQKIHSDVTITFHNIDKIEALEKVKNDEINLAIYPYYSEEDRNFPELSTIEIFSFDPILIMHKDHPLAKIDEKNIEFTDIAKYNFMRTDSDSITIPLFKEASKQYGMNSKINFVNGTWEMAREFVRKNLGIAGVSTAFIDKNDGVIVYKSVARLFTKIPYAIGIKKGIEQNKIVSDFIELLKLNSSN